MYVRYHDIVHGKEATIYLRTMCKYVYEMKYLSCEGVFIIGDVAVLSLATRPSEVDTGNTKNHSFTYY